MFDFLNNIEFTSMHNTILFFGMVMCAPLFAVAWISINEFIEGEKIVVENDWFWTYPVDQVFVVPELDCWMEDYEKAVDRLFIDKKHDVLVWTVQEEEMIWTEQETELCLARCASEFDALTTTHSYPVALLEEYFFGHTMDQIQEALASLPGQSQWEKIAPGERFEILTFGQWIKPCPA